MKRFFWACLAIVAVVVGRNLCGVVHEVGHALATWAVGGQVYSMQPWIFLGRTHTQISNMSDSKAAVVCLSGSLAANLLGVLAVLLVPWNRLSTGVAVALALFLFPCIVESWSFALEVVMPNSSGDALEFVLRSGCDDLIVSFVGLVVLGGSLWLWVHRTRLPSRLKDLWLNPQYD